MRFAEGGTVPAEAFRIRFLEYVLVGFGGPFEGGGEFGGGNLVVVVYEAVGLADGMYVVG